MKRPRAGTGNLVTAAPARPAPSRLAFTMAEVIFAILILGLGLILLAAAFPVGIKQGEKTQDAANASLIAQHALDQINKVPATYTCPTYTAGSWVPLPGLPSPVTAYTGKPLTMGLLDGAIVTDPSNTPNPDLRLKLLYPEWPEAVHPTNPADPTGTDGRPQDPTQIKAGLPALGLAAERDVAGVPVPATFLNVWGWRLEWVGGNPVWYENLQWAYPADRRYYWYAFYRQMNEDPVGYPNPINLAVTPWNVPQQTAVRADHITRRTYRMWIVAAKLPTGFFLAPQQVQVRPAPNNTPADYAAQWYPAMNAANPWLGPAPVRVPFADGLLANLQYGATTGWLSDTVANGYIQTGISSGGIKRGGILMDSWGEVYRIEDLTTNAVRLDRKLPIPGPQVDALLPFWFNPNAIAVFPTIVTKQADLP